jgi:hypothetical protein
VKVSHRGFLVEAYRSKSLGGDTLLYWSIFRESDWHECDSGFSTGSDRVQSFVKLLKERVDAELADGTWSPA